ncbi:PAS domain-containing protein [Sphingosinicella terrae]|uniref:PAS domain-containing protein n=1 Tax=Sphingosinicella terrae TaxID=2172047 RepID=UPI0025488348|nr:PAS domain-containing protein [Sphingosinicella terrae]
MSEVQLQPVATPTPDEIVEFAVTYLQAGDAELRERLDALPAPVYLTDAEGWVTWYNQACVDFAGRRPTPGEDRWCVTWRLYTECGTPLPHEECPMAVAIRQGKPVRGVVAVAERPDGSRVLFTPFPTPAVDADGRVVGAVNLLIDITDSRQAEMLRAQALRCRRLAQSVTDTRTVSTLTLMAQEYEEQASALSA